jgi:hypothetical protein
MSSFVRRATAKKPTPLQWMRKGPFSMDAYGKAAPHRSIPIPFPNHQW